MNGAVYFESESCDGRDGDIFFLDDALHLAQGHRNGEDFAIRNGPFLQLSHRSVSPEYTHKASERAQSYASTARESNLQSGKWWDWECGGCDLKFCSKMLYEEHLLQCPRAILGYPLNKSSVHTTVAYTARKPTDVDEDSTCSSTTNSTELHQQHESSHQSSCSTGYDSQSDAKGRPTSVADSAGKSSCSAEASGNTLDRPNDAAMEDPGHESGRMPLAGLYGRAESFKGQVAESPGLTKDSSASHASRISSERHCFPPSSHPQLPDYGDHQQHAIRSTWDRSSHVHNSETPALMMRLQHGCVWTDRDTEEVGSVSGLVADSQFDLSVDGSYINRYVSLASRLLQSHRIYLATLYWQRDVA